jgi:iron complex transport system permease protein
LQEQTVLSRNPVFLALLAAGTVFLALVSLSMGRFGVPLSAIPRILFHPDLVDNPVFSTVILNVRVPRVLAALLVGASLAVAGSSYQALFRNPMVSPDILGASAGSGFGACLAILLGQSFFTVQLTAFCFGLLSVLVSWAIARAVSGANSGTLSLVLTGMVVSSLFTAFISITKYLADPESKLPAITFWLMGGLSSVKSEDLLFAALPMLLGIIPLLALRWRLNVLSFGDDEARSLGVNTGRLRLAVIVSSTLLTSSAVSVAGMVGWVGLVVPHLARMLVGPDCRMLIPVSLFIGAGFMLVVDDIARCLFPLELPLGILTALVGAPFFLVLLVRGRKGWV